MIGTVGKTINYKYFFIYYSGINILINNKKKLKN